MWQRVCGGKGIDYCHRLTRNTIRHPRSPADKTSVCRTKNSKKHTQILEKPKNGKHCAAPGQLIWLELSDLGSVWVQCGFRVTQSQRWTGWMDGGRTAHQFERSGIHYTPFCTIFLRAQRCCKSAQLKGGPERSGQKSLELPASPIARPGRTISWEYGK